MTMTTASPPTTVGACVTLACVWEATAPKPGNVYRGADFQDLTYADFLTSAAIVGPILEQAIDLGLGQTVLRAVRATQEAVATNTNLGMLLLMTPLAAVPRDESMQRGIWSVLETFGEQDTAEVYEAIRLANPGGIGQVEVADVNETQTPSLPLVAAMQLAANRDLIAKQYTNNFAEVFCVANRVEALLAMELPLAAAIVRAFVELLAQHPDSLIARKCGEITAKEVSAQAAAVTEAGEPGEIAYEQALQEFDFALRTDGHRRNPGTSADLIAAGLFVLLHEDRLSWPIRFYS